jgi:hypothetical protein
MEKFYGPWDLTLNHVDRDSQQRFVISGSDNADGKYNFPFGGFVNLVVTGTAWSISFELVRFPPIPVPRWEQRAVKRTSRFEAGRGLIVELDTIAAPRLSLICISMDPTLNPNPTANPYDFTIPEYPNP